MWNEAKMLRPEADTLFIRDGVATSWGWLFPGAVAEERAVVSEKRFS